MRRYLHIIIFLLLLPVVEVTADNVLLDKYKRWSEINSADLITKAKGYILKDRTDSALICYSIVANRYTPDIDFEEKKVCAQAFNNAGYIYFFHYQDYAKSYAYLIQAMELSEELNLKDNLPYVYLNLGNMYLVYADMYHPKNPLKRSINLFKKGIRVAIDIKDWDVYLTLFINLGNSEISNHTVDSLNNELTEFDKLVIPRNVPKLRYAKLLSQAIRCLQKRDYANARKLFLQQIQANDSPLTPERFEYQALANVVYTLEAEHNYKEAIKYITRIDSLAKANNMRDIEAEACEELSSLYKKMGDMPNANKYRYIYLDKKDSIMTVGKMEEIGEVHFLHELQKVEEQIRDINTKRRIEQIFIWVIIVISVIVVTFLLIINRKNKALRERTHQLYQNTITLLKQEEMKRKQLEEQRQQALSQVSPNTTEEPKASNAQEKYQGSILSEEDKTKIATAIDEVLSIGEQIYDQNFSLDNLAELTGYNSKYVSQVINERYEKNFNTLIGNQRIKEACKRMLDKENYGRLTLEGIARSVGFKSRNTFSVTFKRVTGLTPSEYQKLSKE